MNYIATITSKKQLTLPAKLFNKLNLKVGQKLFVSENDGQIVLDPAENLVEQLAGSLSIPNKWEDKNIDQIIEQSKNEYFKANK